MTPTADNYNDDLHTICKQATELLKLHGPYTQVTIVNKLGVLGINISPASFTNILKNKKVSDRRLKNVADGLRKILERELDMEWKENGFVKKETPGFQPDTVPIPLTEKGQIGFNIHQSGRVSILEKVSFILGACKEVIEFGVTLNKFTSNIYSGNKAEYRDHIEALLKKGVDFKCYLIKEGNNAGLYFEDRAKQLKEEADYSRRIKNNIERLSCVHSELNAHGYPGRFEIFSYDHIPNNYFLVVDAGIPSGKMMVSHYLYGIRRSDCPVMEFTRKDTPILFMRYRDSSNALTKDATALHITL